MLIEVEKLRAQSRARKNLESVRDVDNKANENGDLNTTDEVSSEEIDNKLLLARVIELVNVGLPHGEFSVDHIAESLNMSVSTFRRRMLAATGDSPKNFILAIQMERATEMLSQEPPMSIGDIAFNCGFTDSGSFTRTFRRFYGITPTQFKAQM